MYWSEARRDRGMMGIVFPLEWRRNAAGGVYNLDIPLRFPVGRATVTAAGWAPFEGGVLRWLWRPLDETEPRLHGEFLAGEAQSSGVILPPPNVGGIVLLEASQPPAKTIWRANSIVRSFCSWEDVLPGRDGPLAPKREGDVSLTSKVVDSLAEGDLSSACGELALDLLEGPSAETLVAARTLLRELARRPLLRNPRLGALVAALVNLDIGR